MLIKTMLFLMATGVAQTEKPNEFTYKEAVIIGAQTNFGDLSLDEELFESSRFNYYENQSLRSFSSVFVEGVDQRFLDVSYNGFSLRDPSSPSGVFNLASLAAFKSNRLLLTGGSTLDLVSEQESRTFAEAGVSSLGEFSLGGVHSTCRSNKTCTSVEAVAKRAGGFSQLEAGSEDDFYEELSLSASREFLVGDYKLKSQLLYYGQVLDLDSLLPPSGVLVESETAEALNSVLFVGQDFELSSKHLLKFSYTHSYRNQRDLQNPDPNLQLSFRQRGEVLEASYVYKSDLKLKVFNERFDLYSSRGFDTGIKIQKKLTVKDVVADVSIGKTRLRSADWSVEVGYENFVLFYKGLPASLFQQSYNNEFSPGVGSLNSQEFLGVKYNRRYTLSRSTFLKWNFSYSRVYKFVDFDFLNNAYENLGEVENFFVGLHLVKGPLAFFVQNQVARQVEAVKRNLQRRAPWTLGLRYSKKINTDLSLNAGARWVSTREAFDQTDLNATWMSDFKLSYKNITLTCTNVLAEEDSVFKNLGRRPFSAHLSFQKNF